VTPELISRTYPLDSVEALKPLEKGPHEEAVTAMLTKAGLGLPVMTVDQSHRSRSADLWLTGRAGREYVVITDTFLQQYTPWQVALALAHELGHLRHKLISLCIREAWALLLLLLVFTSAYLLLGPQAVSITAAPRVVLVILFCSLVIRTACTPVSLALSRSEERFADRYAVSLAGDRKEFGRLLLLTAQHELELLDVPGWRYYWSASHPTVRERIALVNSPSMVSSRASGPAMKITDAAP
jgi:Zn-dependent protease with chaperone function